MKESIKSTISGLVILDFIRTSGSKKIIKQGVLFFNWGILLELPDALWTLLTIGVGGYTVGRSAEKVAGKLKKE